MKNYKTDIRNELFAPWITPEHSKYNHQTGRRRPFWSRSIVHLAFIEDKSREKSSFALHSHGSAPDDPLSRGLPPLNCWFRIQRRHIHWKSSFALHGDGSAPNNSTNEHYVQKDTGGHLGFRITKIQGPENILSSKLHRLWFHWPSKQQKPSTEHHFKPNNWKCIQNCLWRPFWILNLWDPRSKLYTDIQYEIILLHQLQKPFIKQHNQLNSENCIQKGNGRHLGFRIIRV